MRKQEGWEPAVIDNNGRQDEYEVSANLRQQRKWKRRGNFDLITRLSRRKSNVGANRNSKEQRKINQSI